MRIQPAVKKETIRIASGTAAGAGLMFLVFFLLHQFWPQSVPFDYRVILGGVAGGTVAVANFFLMGLTVQKIASTTNEKQAYDRMKLSYRNRMFLQLGWVIVALAVPVFNGAAGIIPLFFPSICIKLVNILGLVPQNTTERR